MSLQDEYRYMESGQWAERNPLTCPCRGGGWLLSDLDTWHKCPVHKHEGMGHPEDEGDNEGEMLAECTPEERESYYAAKDQPRIEMLRKLYAASRDAARGEGFTGNFKAACVGLLHDAEWLASYKLSADAEITPAMWAAAAEDVADDAHFDKEADEYEPEGPGITEPWECAYGPRDSGASNWLY